MRLMAYIQVFVEAVENMLIIYLMTMVGVGIATNVQIL